MDEKMDRLSDYGIFGKTTETEKVFLKIEKHFRENKDIPSIYVKKLWERYKEMTIEENMSSQKIRTLNGNIFEAIITTALVKENITPIYTQANLTFVPNVSFDIVVFPKLSTGEVDVSAPIVLSLKTSLRERYKQADLEGLALKDVYKRGISYLINMDTESEIENSNRKISNRDVRGIDGFINATSSEFDELVKKLKENNVSAPPPIQVISSAKEIIV